MRFTLVILSAMLCLYVCLPLPARAQNAGYDKDSDEAIMAAAEKLVNEGKQPSAGNANANANGNGNNNTAQANSALPVVQTGPVEFANEVKKESEIPVFTKSEKLEKSESSLLWRLAGSLALIGVVGMGLYYGARRWTVKVNLGGEKARIEILHQYHMGPRKSVALIRVAGEAILIGCTDHSINMLKTIALIDDEFEGALGKDFNGFLEDDFTIADMRTALSPRA